MTHRKHASILSVAALCAAGLLACDDGTAARSAGVDLSRYGVDEVVADGEGAYRLLADDGAELGRVDREVDGEAVALRVELAGRRAELAWSGAEERASCDAEGGALAGCADALNVAAELAEADGVDVPAFTPAGDDGVDFRSACETISTWVGGSSCSECYSEAAGHSSQGYAHSSGSCSQGTLWTSCTHTFCSGGAQLEQHAN